VFPTKFEAKIKKHIMFNSIIFFFENLIICEIKSKKDVNPDRPQKRIWCTNFPFLINKATNAPSEYVLIINFPLQQWFHKRTAVLRYT